MHATNPALIARTHRIEQAIEAGVSGNFQPFERFFAALQTPYELADGNVDLARAPTQSEIVPQTFCGT